MPLKLHNPFKKNSKTPLGLRVSTPQPYPAGKMWQDKTRKPKRWPRIYLFGDSLTERGFWEHDGGFGWKLEQTYEGRAEVLDRGCSGQTTASLVSYFEKYVIADAATATSPALLVTIFLGANDACFKFPSSDNIVPLTEYIAHLRNYVESVLSSEATKGTRVVLIAPPPIDVSAAEIDLTVLEEDDLNMLKEYQKSGRGHRTWKEKRRYAQAVVELGKKMEAQNDRVSWLDLWTELTEVKCEELGKIMGELEREEMLPGSGMPGAEEFGREWFVDGLHFGPKAYQVLSEHLFALVFQKWPELKRERLELLDP